MSTPPPRFEQCVLCGRSVEATDENEVFDGFSASGCRPSLYAHRDCDGPAPVAAPRSGDGGR